MAFTIPNQSGSVLYVYDGDNRYPQAEPDKVDVDILTQAHNGEGVLSGCAVTAKSPESTSVAVASGSVRKNDGTTQSVSAGDVDCGAAHGSLPRWDLIIANVGTGAKSVVNGTAAALPVFPSGAAVLGTSVVLAAIWRAALDDTITDGPPGAAGDICDKRAIVLDGVVGPASATDTALARFDGATGKLLQDSVVICDASGNITGVLSLEVGGGTPASSGSIRLANNTGTIAWRNAADTSDIPLKVDNLDRLVFPGAIRLAAGAANSILKTEAAGVMAARNATDADYGIFRCDSPVGADDAATKNYADGNITSHEAAGDPHPGYLTPAEHTSIGDGSPHHAKYTNAEALAAAKAGMPFTISVNFLGGGSALTTSNEPCEVEIPANAQITEWRCLLSAAENITITVTKAAYADYDTMTALSPALALSTSGAKKNQATGLTTALTAGWILRFAITGAPASATWARAILKGVRT